LRCPVVWPVYDRDHCPDRQDPCPDPSVRALGRVGSTFAWPARPCASTVIALSQPGHCPDPYCARTASPCCRWYNVRSPVTWPAVIAVALTWLRGLPSVALLSVRTPARDTFALGPWLRV
jgi:hypothetical protein